MTTTILDRLAWQLARRALSGDPYGRAILGDLTELREQVAQRDGGEAARRWFRREALRSWIAFLPSLKFGARAALAAALVSGAVYGVAVNVAGPLAFAATSALHLTAGPYADATYLAIVGTIGAVAGFGLTFLGKSALLRGVTFIGVALVFGVTHILTAHWGEVEFRTTKVVLFVGCALLAALLGLASPRPGATP